MRALLAAALVLLAAAGDARAQGKRDVFVETEPAGADVYLNSKDDGSLCKTPCTIKAPAGEQIVIIEKASYVSLVESVVVPRRGKPAPLKFKLQRALGTIVVKGPEGARIRVGDANKGKAPAKIEVDAGPHTITLTLNGKQVLQDLIEVEPGQEVVVRGKEVAQRDPPKADPPKRDPPKRDPPKADPPEDDPEPPEEKPEPPGDVEVKDEAPKPARPRLGKLVSVTGLIDVGFRSFSYKNPLDVELSDEDEGGQVIFGPLIEVWPGVIAGIPLLRGFAVVGRYQFPLNKQPVEGGAITSTMTTFWQTLEVSARQRWTFRKGTAEVGAGFVRDQHQFNTNDRTQLVLVPDVVYDSIRLGARGSLLVGKVEPYLVAENRIVLSGGAGMKARFPDGASASGLRGALGMSTKLGPILARLEASFTRYSWTFKSDPMDMYRAEGASDSITLISVGVGYAY